MPNGGGARGYGIRPGEYTKPGLETEVKIPRQTYAMIGLIGTISILCSVVAGWMIRLYAYLRSAPLRCYNIGYWWSQFRFICWLAGPWWDKVRVRWPLIVVAIALWWGVVAATPALYRFGLEQITKHAPPVLQPWNPENGMWWPWKKVLRQEGGRPGRLKGRIDFSLGGDDDS